MILEQAEIDRILNPKIRQRALHLPVKRGRRHGELKRCPMRKGEMRHLEPPIPYERYKRIAERQPTQATRLLRLFDLCDRHPKRTVKVTVTLDPQRDGDEWIVYFELGDHRASFDRPFYLAKTGDYTMTPSRQAIPGDPEVLMPLAADLAKARAKALERRITPQQEQLSRAVHEAETLQQSLTNMKARLLIKRAQRNFEAAARLLSEDDVCSDASAAATGSQGEADRLPRSAPLASLESAA